MYIYRTILAILVTPDQKLTKLKDKIHPPLFLFWHFPFFPLLTNLASACVYSLTVLSTVCLSQLVAYQPTLLFNTENSFDRFCGFHFKRGVYDFI